LWELLEPSGAGRNVRRITPRSVNLMKWQEEVGKICIEGRELSVGISVTNMRGGRERPHRNHLLPIPHFLKRLR
jgi:hypothetical protein